MLKNINNIISSTLTPLLTPPQKDIAVACSGGPDSMALVLLCHEFAALHGIRLHILTVDHTLRTESATECALVAQWMQSFGLRHIILQWDSSRVTGNIQAAARDARYALLTDYCRAHHVPLLLTAHTADDQAETFLLRLARGSGVDGLASMAAASAVNGIRLARPLLNVRKSLLLAYLNEKKQPFINDPSNVHPRYLRTHMRSLLPSLEATGITVERINKAAANMRRTRGFLEQCLHSHLKSHTSISPYGYMTVHTLPEHQELRLRLYALMMKHIGGAAYPPRLDELEHLDRTLFPGRCVKPISLAGLLWRWHKTGLLCYREPSAAQRETLILTAGAVDCIWDHRYRVRGTLSHSVSIQAVTKKHFDALPLNPLPELPLKAMYYTLPALVDLENANILAIPHLQYRIATHETVPTQITFMALEAIQAASASI